MGIEEHGNQDDEIAEEDGQNGLHPVHALGPRRDRFVKAPCARRRNADGGRG
jgi:hypothetical protein